MRFASGFVSLNGGRMKALVLGSGGREHALAWKLSSSLGQENVLVYPGNAGILACGFSALQCEAEPLSVAQTAKTLGISLIVIGPEAMLADGYGNTLRQEGFLVVGPNKEAARLESSKVFAKEFMKRAGIPTADFQVADSAASLEAIDKFPIVLKLDGLAAGKGVVIAHSREDARLFCERVWNRGEFGPGPHRVVIEEMLSGNELSYMGLCDGRRFIPLSTATDYKRVGDENSGGNTGGMGSISPSPFFSSGLKEKIDTRIISKVLKRMERESLDFRGVLYIGLMITAQGDPFVLEFNTRFGDPETQAILLRLQSDFVSLLTSTARGVLSQCPEPSWSSGTSVYVVAAAEGYPGHVRKGDIIEGLDSIPEETPIFYSGVQKDGDHFVTGGGRVLGLGAVSDTAADARSVVYGALENIRWKGMHYRKDIGRM